MHLLEHPHHVRTFRNSLTNFSVQHNPKSPPVSFSQPVTLEVCLNPKLFPAHGTGPELETPQPKPLPPSKRARPHLQALGEIDTLCPTAHPKRGEMRTMSNVLVSTIPRNIHDVRMSPLPLAPAKSPSNHRDKAPHHKSIWPSQPQHPSQRNLVPHPCPP